MTIELPTECLIKIFEQFTVKYNQEEFDYVSLRSCLLVNRQWCVVAVPMLWEEPLMNLQLHKSTHDRFHMPITTYIMSLNDETKIILSKCGIIITPTLKRKATFNYATFLRHLDNEILFKATKIWIEKCNIISKEEQCFLPIFQIYQLLDQLFKNFIENCNNLKILGLKKSNQVRSLSDAFLKIHLLPGAEISLKNLNEISFDGCMDSEIFLKASEISKNIQHLHIDCVCMDNEGLAKFIQVQQRPLLSLSIETTTIFKIPIIENSLKNKINSLTSLFIDQIFSLNIFSNCNNLEKLSITHSEPMHEDLMENFVESNFSKLRELQLQLDHPFLHQISTLIKNTNGNLTSIYLYWKIPKDTNNYSLLISTIIMNCPNLTEYLGSYSNVMCSYLPLLFEKCSKLEYFYLYDIYDNNNSTFYDISNIMKLISKVIPKNLKVLWLSETWTCNSEALNIFLEGCEIRLSEPLLFFIYDRTHQHDEILKKYIVKNVLTQKNN
ncbi:hypothetical protein C1645_773858 [Glomus cerebriforme]|uniref:Uncharacterized protein n=1 Tax=Glomus cerebriforme TaxID=658196 RepID=A0A397SSZ8_9GLOM|nr:hypothetical protein C1645_773858 [Glomus cerebriforme]